MLTMFKSVGYNDWLRWPDSLSSGISVWVGCSMIVIVYAWVELIHKHTVDGVARKRRNCFYVFLFSYSSQTQSRIVSIHGVIITFRTWMNKSHVHIINFLCCFHLCAARCDVYVYNNNASFNIFSVARSVVQRWRVHSLAIHSETV